MDEVFLTIKDERHYLWRAVDQEGNVLDILVQRRRNKRAAKKFFRQLLKGVTCVPRVLSTDTLKSSGAATREILPGGEPSQPCSCKNGQKTLPSLLVSASGACTGFSLLVRPSGSLPPMGPSRNIFVRGGIG